MMGNGNLINFVTLFNALKLTTNRNFPFCLIINPGNVQVPAGAGLMMPALSNESISFFISLSSFGGCLYGDEKIGVSDVVSILKVTFLQYCNCSTVTAKMSSKLFKITTLLVP